MLIKTNFWCCLGIAIILLVANKIHCAHVECIGFHQLQCSLLSGATTDTFVTINSLDHHGRVPKSAIHFELNMNDPGTISATFPQLTSIHLNVSAIEFPTNLFKTLPRLEFFNGTKNYLQTISAGIFAKSNKLKILDLTRNDVRSIQSNAFNGLNELQYLLLSVNLLTEIKTNTFDGLQNVEGIDLSANFIISIQDDAFNLANLQTVRLQNNRVYTLTDNAFNGANKLKVIDLSANPLMFPNRAFVNCDKLAVLALCKTSYLNDEELVVGSRVAVYRTDDECEHVIWPAFF